VIISAEEVVKYIPQRFPFIMVGAIKSVTEQQITTRFLIEEENILLQDNCFSVAGLLENIAQSAAAQAGYAAAEQGNATPMGFIGAISKVEVNKLPPVGSSIETTVKIVQEVFGITLITGEVMHKQELLIKCQLKIMIAKPEDE